MLCGRERLGPCRRCAVIGLSAYRLTCLCASVLPSCSVWCCDWMASQLYPFPNWVLDALHHSISPPLQRLVLRLDGWDQGSHYPHSHLVRVLGPINSLRCVFRCRYACHAAQQACKAARAAVYACRRCGVPLNAVYAPLASCKSADAHPTHELLTGARQMACWSAAACTGSPSGGQTGRETVSKLWL